jgi:hypothetical protein
MEVYLKQARQFSQYFHTKIYKCLVNFPDQLQLILVLFNILFFRFHELSEFDDTKRSCRRRLAGHNERRRKNASDYQGE